MRRNVGGSGRVEAGGGRSSVVDRHVAELLLETSSAVLSSVGTVINRSRHICEKVNFLFSCCVFVLLLVC